MGPSGGSAVWYRRACAAARIAGATATTANFDLSVATAATAAKATNGVARQRGQVAASPRGKADAVDAAQGRNVLTTAVTKIVGSSVAVAVGVDGGAGRIGNKRLDAGDHETGGVARERVARNRAATGTTAAASNNKRRN